MQSNNLKSVAWAIGLWGVMSIIFGALVLAWPGITLKVFLIIIGINFVATGAVLTVGSLADRNGHWVGGVLMGALSLIAGIYVFANPQTTGLVLIYLLAIWAIAVGAIQIVSGFESKEDKGWLIFSGIVSLLFGIYIFGRPLTGALALIWAIGLYAIISGVMLIVTAFKANSIQKDMRKVTATARR
jgi:uncharacterized membrane protein HdeD (DUF308 family)